ncbi:MAG: hypothetical protein Cons2KO_14990 [Congregibacter sp.]
MPDAKQPPATRSLIGIGVVTAIALGMAFAGSQGSARVAGYPVFAIATALAFGIQLLAFIPAYMAQTERYYDLVGSITYLSVTGFALWVNPQPGALLLTAMVGVWALRLGSFLFTRILQDGSDQRFDRIKPYFLRFLLTWLLQGLWVTVTAGAAIAAMSSSRAVPLGVFAVVGLALWLIGFGIEAVADRQKRVFRKDPANKGRFITSGLWAWSRHPNYFGEILLWFGVSVVAFPALSGWQLLTLVSPLFVYLLLTRVSGVPALESQGKRRWGDDPEYRAYVASTPALVLRPPR